MFIFRCKQWIKNSGREDLINEPINRLSKKYFLCSDHFQDDCFTNPKYKTKFKNNCEPVPTIFLNNFTEFLPKSIQKKISSKMCQNIDDLSLNEIFTTNGMIIFISFGIVFEKRFCFCK